MFGMFKRQPAEPMGPFEFEHKIEIERSAADIYAMIDLGDPRNAKRARGNKVVQAGPERFEMEFDLCPGHVFGMTVTEAVPGKAYGWDNDVTPPVGNLVNSSEAYAIEATGEASCRVGLTISAWFDGGLSAEEMALEVMMMGTAGQNGLAKLKVQAEQGVEAVHAIEAQQMDAFEDDWDD